MSEIEFSIMEQGAFNPETVLPMLSAFESQSFIKVKLDIIPWSTGWTEISKYGIYGYGPDVSEIGTSWVGSLASMQALRAYTPAEIHMVGGKEAFFEGNWQTGLIAGEEDPYAIPLQGDGIVLYYWKDQIEKAGIGDPQSAFSSHESLVAVLTRLQESGVRYPLAIVTKNESRSLHQAAGWIWSAGGDFLSPDQKRVAFNEDHALNGLRQYFSLHRFISPETLTVRSADLFGNETAAITLAGGNLETDCRRPGWEQNLGVARPLTCTYVGGTSLVIWKHTIHEKEALELVRFISTLPVRVPANPHEHQIPTRRDALNVPSAEYETFRVALLGVLQNGRSYPTVRLWGMIEEKLNQEITSIWQRLFANPGLDIDDCLHGHLDPLAKRLNITLGNFG